MIQSGEFLGRLPTVLLKAGLLLMKNVNKPLSESVLIALGLPAATSAADAGTSAADAGIRKKILGSGTITLIISKEEMEDIKIVKCHEDSGLLLKGVSETIQYETKEQRGFLGMLIGKLGASLLENMLTGKGIIRAGCSSKDLRSKDLWFNTGKGIVRASYGSKGSSMKDF